MCKTFHMTLQKGNKIVARFYETRRCRSGAKG